MSAGVRRVRAVVNDTTATPPGLFRCACPLSAAMRPGEIDVRWPTADDVERRLPAVSIFRHVASRSDAIMDYLPALVPEHSAMRSSSFPTSSGPATLRGRRVATPALVLVTLTLVPPAASLAQRPTGFTANDALEVVSTQVGDLSAD